MTDDGDHYERAEAMEMAQDRWDEERAELEAAVSRLHRDYGARIADLELRLQIATETNVADRQRIDAMERSYAHAQDTLDVRRKRIAELESGLREALGLVRSEPTWLSEEDIAKANILRKLLPSGTT